MQIKIKIDNHEYRKNFVSILAEQGIKVWVVSEKDYLSNTFYYVIFEYEPKEKTLAPAV